MPSLNGYWIFNNRFTDSQWESMITYFQGGSTSFTFRVNEGGDTFSENLEYIDCFDNTLWFFGEDYGQIPVCYKTLVKEGYNYYGDWTDSNLYGPNARLIMIVDDQGFGEDSDFYNFWTSIATEISMFPLNNSKWYFNSSLSNLVDYAPYDEDAIIDSDIWIRSNNITFSRIAFDLYYGNVYALSYGWNSVYGNGWTDSVYRTLNIYDFPLLPYPESSEREKTTNILDVIALIGRNATYQGSADPWTRIYKLGWRVQNNS